MSRSRILKVRVTEDEHAALIRRATAEDVSISNLIRAGLYLDAGSRASYARTASASRLGVKPRRRGFWLRALTWLKRW